MVELYIYRLKPEEKNSSLEFLKKSVRKAFPGNNIEVYKDENGKPHTDKENVFVSATHTGNVVICAVAEEEVGIDAEQYKNVKNMERIAHRFFTSEEAELVEKYGSKVFFGIWCRKEAFVKHNGKGLAYGLKRIETVKRGGFADSIKGVRMIGGISDDIYFACAGGRGDLVWMEIQE